MVAPLWVWCVNWSAPKKLWMHHCYYHIFIISIIIEYCWQHFKWLTNDSSSDELVRQIEPKVQYFKIILLSWSYVSDIKIRILFFIRAQILILWGHQILHTVFPQISVRPQNNCLPLVRAVAVSSSGQNKWCFLISASN